MMTTPSIATVTPRPFLKWAGGKHKLIQQYIPYLPSNFERYFEPFLGGGALFFHLKPKRAYLSDINGELINTYVCVRDQVDALIAQLEIHQQRHSKPYYYQVRSSPESDPIRKAARFIYLNRTCFNGLYRENAKGEFNVPIGRYRNPNICRSALLREVAQVLQDQHLSDQPFEAIVEQALSSEDFVYFDPPYRPISDTSDFTHYSRYNFSDRHQEQLSEVFRTLASQGVQVMLSNSDCDFIRELYADFPCHTVTAARAINSNPQKRGRITELVITSY